MKNASGFFGTFFNILETHSRLENKQNRRRSFAYTSEIIEMNGVLVDLRTYTELDFFFWLRRNTVTSMRAPVRLYPVWNYSVFLT